MSSGVVVTGDPAFIVNFFFVLFTCIAAVDCFCLHRSSSFLLDGFCSRPTCSLIRLVLSFFLRSAFSTFGYCSFFVYMLLRNGLSYHKAIPKRKVSQNLHGRYPVYLFFGLVPNFSFPYIGSSLIICRSSIVIDASAIAFFFFVFVPYFLSCFIVMYFDISSSSAEDALKLRSFWISIGRLQISSGFCLRSVLPRRSLLGCDRCYVST